MLGPALHSLVWNRQVVDVLSEACVAGSSPKQKRQRWSMGRAGPRQSIAVVVVAVAVQKGLKSRRQRWHGVVGLLGGRLVA